MEWEEYASKKRFRRVITNTFSSNEDCEMFIMVLKQQWPKHINKLPDSELEITRSIESPNICLLYTSPSPRDRTRSRMPSSA